MNDLKEIGFYTLSDKRVKYTFWTHLTNNEFINIFGIKI